MFIHIGNTHLFLLLSIFESKILYFSTFSRQMISAHKKSTFFWSYFFDVVGLVFECLSTERRAMGNEDATIMLFLRHYRYDIRMLMD